ncbi:MAG TPA: DEAD/DEAH box helicase [Tetragenococcus sp.]|nr:DEAD/DEAH box helicase [Tetragenococcus sp.]
MGKAIFLARGFRVDQPADDLEKALQERPYHTLYQQGFTDKIFHTDPAIAYLIKIAQVFVEELKSDGEIELRRKFSFPAEHFYQKWANQVPFVIGYEFVTPDWLRAIHQELADIFETETQNFTASVAAYIQSKNKKLTTAGRVYFHLIERKNSDSPFAFLATYATSHHGKVNHRPLKNALKEFNDSTEILSLLTAVGKVADESAFISQLVESGELFSPLAFNEQEAYQFLKETPLYEENGVICRIPNFWKKENKASVKITVGAKEPSKLGIDALLSSKPEMYLGSQRYSKAEIETLLQQNEGLAFIKGKWIEINHEKLQKLLQTFEAQQDKDWTFFDSLRQAETTNKTNTQTSVEVTNGQWLARIFKEMTTPQKIRQAKPKTTFKATLRPYQSVGFNWLKSMQKRSLGALLADDMGLGKTVQILALLDYLRKDKTRSLLVIPASLLENWKKEATRFTPNLQLQILHGKEKDFKNSSADLLITTYGMVSRIPELAEENFDLLILDEAQAIKNPATKQTKSIKALHADAKIAMTGTPIENRLSDLWSVFDFLNQGLLGTKKEFSQTVKNGVDYNSLRQMISPFILRRLKTDKKVIADLPEKNEQKEYIALTKKQVALYKGVQRDIEKSLEASEGIQRKGLVLAAISKFKQICNHPDQYLGNEEFKGSSSGKFEKLAEICATIRDKHEQVLIFTQFKEMCQPLNEFLAKVFGQTGLVLHGSIPSKKRGKLVQNFNDPTSYTPYLILSIKAGGVGLNLTAANHVIHFDRWWNPAIENQATDRAFRIGQKKNVFVYKFVTSGTIEEKIDNMLSEKTQLSQELITATHGESWLTEMNNEELKQLFTLEVN